MISEDDASVRAQLWSAIQDLQLKMQEVAVAANLSRKTVEDWISPRNGQGPRNSKRRLPANYRLAMACAILSLAGTRTPSAILRLANQDIGVGTGIPASTYERNNDDGHQFDTPKGDPVAFDNVGPAATEDEGSMRQAEVLDISRKEELRRFVGETIKWVAAYEVILTRPGPTLRVLPKNPFHELDFSDKGMSVAMKRAYMDMHVQHNTLWEAIVSQGAPSRQYRNRGGIQVLLSEPVSGST